MTLVINLGPQPIRIFRNEEDQTGSCFPHSVVWGPQTRYAVRDTTRKGAVVGIQFRPGMAGAVLGVPAPELTDRFVSLEELWGRKAEDLRLRLMDVATPLEKIASAQELLSISILRPLLIHPAVATALHELAQPEAPTVEAVQAQAGYSAKRFIELFSAVTGMTPKRYSRLQRFQNVLKLASSGNERPEWARIAAEGGYADQAHLSHEFKEFSGITPGAYRPVQPGWINHVAIGDRLD